MQNYVVLFISIILVNNFVLAKFLGLCPFVGVSKRTKDAVGMGFAVVFVMTMASIVTWLVNRYFLVGGPENVFYLVWGKASALDPAQFDFQYLSTVVFILVIATLVQFVEMFLMKMVPPLYESLGIYLPLITTNCAVMGVALLNAKDFGMLASASSSFIGTVVQGFGAGVGFLMVLYLMSGIRERLDKIPVPDAMKGVPIAFICAGLMALAFMGFAGIGQ
jgi:electron transport complex protein RnfA